MQAIRNSEICAVITTFRPNQSIVARTARVRDQVGHTIVVDDTGSAASTLDRRLFDSNVTYILNDENSGIAKALNVGVAAAVELGYEWALTLDDDTVISETYVTELLAFLAEGVIDARLVGAISLSRARDDKKNGSTGPRYRRKRALITSGSLIRASTFNAVGGFDEGLFIDLVDFDFCTKLRRQAYEVIELANVGMQHPVGNAEARRCFGLQVTIYNHAPFRLYYQVRNCLLFFRRNVFFDPLFALYLLLDVVRVPLKAILFENDKRSRLGYASRGIVDGMTGKTGKYVDGRTDKE
jgi:rhamnosyltransferase